MPVKYRRARSTRHISEPLEPRLLMAQFYVDNTNDAGAGSLRQAILDANARPTTDAAHTITFSIGGGVQTIRPNSAGRGALPAVTSSIFLDGTAPIVTGRPELATQVIQISGELAPAGSDGLRLEATGAVRRLTINRFAGHGISLANGGSVTASNIGTDVTGTLDLGNGGDGVHVAAGTAIIGHLGNPAPNVISGNGGDGVELAAASTATRIQSNHIGTNAAGTAAIPNAGFGVRITGSHNNDVGGDGVTGNPPRIAPNVISGNAAGGIRITNGASGTAIRGNFIGTSADGSAAIPNGGDGISYSIEATDPPPPDPAPNLIGGTSQFPTYRNVISGNAGNGIALAGTAPAGAPVPQFRIEGNYIGVDGAGTAALPNGTPGPAAGLPLPGTGYGLRVRGSGFWVSVGSSTSFAEARNVISGNLADGVHVDTAAGRGRFVEIRHSRIGTNAAGTAAVGNGGDGVHVRGGYVTLGASAGGSAGPANLISGNAGDGVELYGPAASGNLVTANSIGTAAGGAAAVPNRGAGLRIEGARDTAVRYNLISGNAGDGVEIRNGPGGAAAEPASGNTFIGNRIGLASDPFNRGTLDPLGNAGAGINIDSGDQNTVGGMQLSATDFNLIGHNGGDGVSVAAGSRNLVASSRVFNNGGDGIDLGPDGPTPNDPLDADAGANDLQNAPVLTWAAAPPGSSPFALVRGTLHTAPNRPNIRIHVYYNPPGSDPGEGHRFVGGPTVSTDAAGNATFEIQTGGGFVDSGGTVTATATDPQGNTSEFSAPAVIRAPAVTGRHVFYNRSAFDANSAAANAADDAAVAADKVALLPGQTASFVNYTCYDKGLNGLMIDLLGLPTSAFPSSSDFEFRVGNDDTPGDWPQAPAPTVGGRRNGAGAGGADRFTFTWPDGAIKGRWLRVTVKSTAGTRLASPDVFYFGSAPGETGNSALNAQVTTADEIGARAHQRPLANRAPVTDRWDFDRDRRVGPADQLIARRNKTTSSTALRLITPATPALRASSSLAARSARPAILFAAVHIADRSRRDHGDALPA